MIKIINKRQRKLETKSEKKISQKINIITEKLGVDIVETEPIKEGIEKVVVKQTKRNKTTIKSDESEPIENGIDNVETENNENKTL